MTDERGEQEGPCRLGGAEHSAITVDEGSMYTFGWGRYGNLGHGHVEDVHVPTKVAGLDGQNVTHPVCGWRHSAALTDEGRLWTFGWSKYGQLGHGDNVDHWTPKLLPEFEGGPITAASGGWRHMCALAGSTGTLYAWGWNQFGQLGVGTTIDANSPQHVIVGADEAGPGGDDAGAAARGLKVSAVSCGWRHTVAVAGDDDGLYTWGRCTDGQLGHGDTTPRNAPKRVQAFDLLRQGIGIAEPQGDGQMISLGVGGGHAATSKRLRAQQQDLMEVPSGKKLHEDPNDDFAAVPDSAAL